MYIYLYNSQPGVNRSIRSQPEVTNVNLYSSQPGANFSAFTVF